VKIGKDERLETCNNYFDLLEHKYDFTLKQLTELDAKLNELERRLQEVEDEN